MKGKAVIYICYENPFTSSMVSLLAIDANLISASDGQTESQNLHAIATALHESLEIPIYEYTLNSSDLEWDIQLQLDGNPEEILGYILAQESEAASASEDDEDCPLFYSFKSDDSSDCYEIPADDITEEVLNFSLEDYSPEELEECLLEDPQVMILFMITEGDVEEALLRKGKEPSLEYLAEIEDELISLFGQKSHHAKRNILEGIVNSWTKKNKTSR